MTCLHFQPIKGKAPEIVDAILETKEVAAAKNYGFINMANSPTWW